MGPRLLSLIAAFAFIPQVKGGEGGYEVTKWFTTTCWETSLQEKSVTFYDTKWSTTTYYTTLTTKETDYITVTTTEVKPVTTTETVLNTVYNTIYDTVYDTVITTATSVQVSGYTNTETAIVLATETAISLATETAAFTSISVVLSTIYETITPEPAIIASPVTVTSCPPTTLEGLVLCPSRTSKPVQKSFPTDYSWGCPPKQICKPKQINCNFEQNWPEEGYYCDPLDGDECVEAPPLPRYTNLEGPWPNYTCGLLYDPSPPYFDFDPHYFGLDFSIYNFGGQVAKPCETPPPPSKTYSPEPIYSPSEWQAWSPPVPSPDTSTEWQAWSPPLPSPEISTEWQAWSPAAVTPSPPVPPKDSAWHKEDSSPAPPGSKTWGDWTKTGERSHVTPRAALLARQDEPEGQPLVPYICLEPCNACGRTALQAGKVYDDLCLDETDFQGALEACNLCIRSNKNLPPNGVPPLLNSLNQYLTVCDNPPTTTEPVPDTSTVTAAAQTTEVTTTTVPAAVTNAVATTVDTSTPAVDVTTPSPTPSSPTGGSIIIGDTTTFGTTITPPAESVTLITSCNCVTITSTLAGSVPVTQITDGQVQAPTGPATFTGVGSKIQGAESGWLITLVLSILALING